MRKEKVNFKNRIEYLILTSYIFFIKVSPLFLKVINRKIICFFFKSISKRHSRIVCENLRTAFPEHSKTAILKLKKKIYYHFSYIFMETLYLYLKKKPEKILKKIEVKNIEYVKDALKGRRGVILFSAHFGNWELIPFILSRGLKTKICSIARQMDNPLVEEVIRKFRQYMGSNIIYKKGSVRKTLKLLEDNNIFFYLVDQNTIPREGVFVDFFSKKVCASTSVTQLHLKKKIPVIPVFLFYEKDKIVLSLMKEIKFNATNNDNNDIKNLTQRLTSIIEEKIREYPEQWFWFHNRWKTKPERRGQ